MAIAAFVAVAYVLCGMYGSIGELGDGNTLLKMFLLYMGGTIVIFREDFEKSYGLQSNEIAATANLVVK